MEKLPNNGEQWVQIREEGLDFRNVSQVYSKELIEILRRMTMPNWMERPSASEILKHKFFNEAEHSKLTRRSNLFGARRTNGKKR